MFNCSAVFWMELTLWCVFLIMVVTMVYYSDQFLHYVNNSFILFSNILNLCASLRYLRFCGCSEKPVRKETHNINQPLARPLVNRRDFHCGFNVA